MRSGVSSNIACYLANLGPVSQWCSLESNTGWTWHEVKTLRGWGRVGLHSSLTSWVAHVIAWRQLSHPWTTRFSYLEKYTTVPEKVSSFGANTPRPAQLFHGIGKRLSYIREVWGWSQFTSSLKFQKCPWQTLSQCRGTLFLPFRASEKGLTMIPKLGIQRW